MAVISYLLFSCLCDLVSVLVISELVDRLDLSEELASLIPCVCKIFFLLLSDNLVDLVSERFIILVDQNYVVLVLLFDLELESREYQLIFIGGYEGVSVTLCYCECIDLSSQKGSAEVVEVLHEHELSTLVYKLLIDQEFLQGSTLSSYLES